MKTAPPSLALLGALTLAGCGAGSGSGAAAPAPTESAAAPAAQQGQQRRAPGVSGLVAAIEGRTLQVQGAESQTAVVYTASTTFTEVVPARSGDVRVGLCAMVTSAAQADATAPPTAVTATSVMLSTPVDGECGGGQGGGGRALASMRPNASPPAGTRPSGASRLGGVGGEVTAVNGSSFTVAGNGFAGPGATASPTPRLVTVSTTGATTFTKQQPATAAALQTGVCVTARGDEDETGTVTATSIAVRPAVDGACTGGFGGVRNG